MAQKAGFVRRDKKVPFLLLFNRFFISNHYDIKLADLIMNVNKKYTYYTNFLVFI